jgi:hypothetical protein
MREGNSKFLVLRGIERDLALTAGNAGSMDELVNLREDGGSLRPALPMVAVGALGKAYAKVYIHTTTEGRRNLIVLDGGSLLYLGSIDSGDNVIKIEPAGMGLVQGGVVSVVGIASQGNVLSVTYSTGAETDKGVNFLFDPSYVQTGFTAGVGGYFLIDFRSLPLRVDFNVKVGHQARLYIDDTGGHTYYETNVAEDVVNAAVENVCQRARAVESKDGHLTGYSMVVSAIELFDGSIILHSAPTLLCAPNSANEANSNKYYRFSSGAHNSLSQPPSDIDDNYYNTDISGDFYYIVEEQGQVPVLNGWNEPSADRTCPNYTAVIKAFAPDINKICCFVRFGLLEARVVGGAVPAHYQRLIKSINVYMTEEVFIVKPKEYRSYQRNLLVSNWKSYNIKQTQKERVEIKKELFEKVNFHKVAEIPIESVGDYASWKELDLKGKLGDLLSVQTVLPVDSSSWHKIVGGGSYVYNSMLHLYNIKTVLFNGFTLSALSDYQYNADEAIPDKFAVHTGQSARYYVFEITVTLPVNNQEKRVKVSSGTVAGELFGEMFKGILSYPDRRATKIDIKLQRVINEIDSFYYTQSFALTGHGTHNFAYYVKPSLESIIMGDFAWDLGWVPDESVSLEASYAERNKIKVSAVDNPFFFPSARTYITGNGVVLSVMSNTVALSSGQFGEYPLYVFSSDGIYALYQGSVSGDVVYSQVKAVSRDVAVSGSVVSTDNAVVFVSGRGLMVVSGSSVAEISGGLDGAIFPYWDSAVEALSLFRRAMAHPHLGGLSEGLSEGLIEGEFRGILGSLQPCYLYAENEFWVFPLGARYAYVRGEGGWGRRFLPEPVSVVWDYPHIYLSGVSSGLLYKLGSENRSAGVVCSFLTRPMSLGTDGFKQSYRVVLRGHFHLDSSGSYYAGLYVFGSNDGLQWAFTGGTERRGASGAVITNLGAVTHRVDFKYLRVGFVGRLVYGSYITGLDVSVSGRGGNKIR